jgi:MGT family glycosyltransferase
LARGFKVTWISDKPGLEKLIPAGGAIVQLEKFDTSSAVTHYEGQPGLPGIQALYEREFLPRNQFIYEQLLSSIDGNQFDYIITDQQAFAGALYAYQHDIPFAVSVTTPATIDPSVHFPEVYEFERQQAVTFQQAQGCSLDKPLVWSSPVTLIYTTTEFLQTEQFPENYHFIGPSIDYRAQQSADVFLYGRENRKRPLVLVSMGVTKPSESDFIEKIVSAFEFMNVDVVLVANPAIRSSWPSNFFVFDFIPQLKVLEVIDVVVCHAGHNTVVEALSKGIPILAIPCVHDQGYIAGKVVDCGAGLRLKYKRFKSEQVSEAVQVLLDDPSYRDAARRIQKSFQRSGGAERAADLIESHIYEFRKQSTTA